MSGTDAVRPPPNEAPRRRVAREVQLRIVGLRAIGVPKPAGCSTSGFPNARAREGSGHAGVILFRRMISQMDYGKQSRLLVEFWREAKDWDWTDRIEYLPRP